MSWDQRARRLRRRKQRRVAAAAVTLAGGQLAWMVTRGASPVEALEANRSHQILSACRVVTNSCPQSFSSPGGVTDIAVSDDGETVAFITSEALVAADTDDQNAQPQFRRDVYVSQGGSLLLVTDDDHPDQSFFWNVGTEVDISGDGRHVTWTMQDDNNIVLFLPPAMPVATVGDTDADTDLFVADVDANADGILDAAAGPPLLVSMEDNETFLPRNVSQPAISRDGRFIAYTHVNTGQVPLPTEVRLHDRDADGNGVFDETGAGQTTAVVGPGSLPAGFAVVDADQPEVAADGGFVVFRAYDRLATSETGIVRLWRRSDGAIFDVTAADFTSGSLDGTAATWPSVSADGTTVAYDFEFAHPNPDVFGNRHQTVVVRIDPGTGALVPDDPATELPEGPYIVSQVPTDADPLTRISDSTTGSFPTVSDDGRYVVYESNADNVAGHLGSGNSQIYAVDTRQVADVDRVPVLVTENDFTGPGDDGSDNPDVSGDGSTVAFTSTASNLATFPTITGEPNAFRMEWGIDVEGASIVFPDTAVGATSGPLTVVFDTDDFGPWFGSAVELLDSYVDPNEHDYAVVGDCASPVAFHAGDPCAVQVTFTPRQVGTRNAELCLTISGSFFCETSAIVGGQAVVPDGPGPIVRESLTNNGDQITGAGGSFDPVISADGRYVAFVTDAAVDPDDTDGLLDIYVRDRLRGTTRRITVSGPPNGASEFDRGNYNPTISADGRFIAYQSRHQNAAEPPPPGTQGNNDFGAHDIFLVDRGQPDANGDFVTLNATTTLVSVAPAGGALFEDATDPSISGDGTQVAFTVVGGEGGADVLVRDLTAPGGARTVGLDAVLVLEVSDTDSPAISADGAHVAFVGRTELGISQFGSPVTSDIVYVYDRDLDFDGVLDEAGQSRAVQITTGEFTPVGNPSGNTPDFRTFGPLQDTASLDPTISGDGSTVAYGFQQTYDFDNADLPMSQRLTPIPAFDDQIIVADRDATTGAPLDSEVVSVAGPGDPNRTEFENIADNAGRCLVGGEGCGPSADPDISDDGRYVTFATQATNLVVSPAKSLPGFSFCGDGGSCDIVAVDRSAVSNGGGPQHVNLPPGQILDDTDDDPFSSFDRQVGTPSISGDGRFIAFDTEAEYFLGYQDVEPDPDVEVLGPVDSNDAIDVYLREWQPVVDPSLPVVFPDTQLGATSAAQSAGVSTQDFGPAPVLGVELTGANPGDFLIIDSLNCLPPLPGAPPPVAAVPPVPVHGRVQLGNGCSVFVAFRPTELGVRSATLRVTTGHPFSAPGTATQIVDIPLTGGGAGQGGFSSQPTFDFGSQIVTTTSPEIAIPITNTGNTPFQITNISIGGTNPGDFTIVGTDCIGFLAPGASCTVRVTFTPTGPGERSAVLIITDTAPGGPHAIGLTGRAPFPTLILNPGVVVAGRTVQIQGFNWAPGQLVTITTADAFSPNPNDPAAKFPERLELTANLFGGIDGSLLLFPKSASGPRIVIADGPGAPPVLTAFQPLLISVSTVGVDFITRG